MTLVTVTYKAWDHNRKVIPASAQPRVGFRPLATSRETGLMTDRENWGTLDPATGVGEVKLESFPGVLYVPFMDWVIDDTDADPANRAREYCEWEPIYPGDGGPLEQLPDVVKLSGIWYGFGSPPDVIRKRNDSLYLNITGPGIGIWVPEFARFSEGVVV